MKQSNFFAMLFRMKYINRWALMRNSREETLSEHCLEVALIAHCLATIRNKRFGGNADADRAAVIGLLHDSSEIITGDLPTPVKYYNSDIKTAYKQLENEASHRLLNMLPEDLREEYEPFFSKRDDDAELWQLCKAADKISALIKCTDERKMGNPEFREAEKSTLRHIKDLGLPEADVFIKEFLPAFGLTLDELNKE